MGSVVKIAVMGARDCTDSELVGSILEKTILAVHQPTPGHTAAPPRDSLLVLGGATGVEQQAREWADSNDYSYVLYKPPFMVDSHREHNPHDFRVRKKQMVDNCDVLVIIKRPGDGDFDSSIRRAIKLGKTVITQEVYD